MFFFKELSLEIGYIVSSLLPQSDVHSYIKETVLGSQDSLVVYFAKLILATEDIAGGSMDNHLLARQKGHP